MATLTSPGQETSVGPDHRKEEDEAKTTIVGLVWNLLQEIGYQKSARILAAESHLFFDIDYFVSMIRSGNLDEADRLASEFVCAEDSLSAARLIFEIRKVKFLEAVHGLAEWKDRHTLVVPFRAAMAVFDMYDAFKADVASLVEWFKGPDLGEADGRGVFRRDEVREGLVRQCIGPHGLIAEALREGAPAETEVRVEKPAVPRKRLQELFNQALTYQYVLWKHPTRLACLPWPSPDQKAALLTGLVHDVFNSKDPFTPVSQEPLAGLTKDVQAASAGQAASGSGHTASSASRVDVNGTRNNGSGGDAADTSARGATDASSSTRADAAAGGASPSRPSDPATGTLGMSEQPSAQPAALASAPTPSHHAESVHQPSLSAPPALHLDVAADGTEGGAVQPEEAGAHGGVGMRRSHDAAGLDGGDSASKRQRVADGALESPQGASSPSESPPQGPPLPFEAGLPLSGAHQPATPPGAFPQASPRALGVFTPRPGILPAQAPSPLSTPPAPPLPALPASDPGVPLGACTAAGGGSTGGADATQAAEPATGAVATELEHEAISTPVPAPAPTALALPPPSVSLFSYRTRRVELAHQRAVNALVYSNAGDYLVSMGQDGELHVHRWSNISHLKLKGTVNVGRAPECLCPKGGNVMTNDGPCSAHLASAQPALAIAKNDAYLISAMGGMGALFSGQAQLTTWARMKIKLLQQEARQGVCMTFCHFHPSDSNFIACGLSNGQVKIVPIQKTGSELVVPERPGGAPISSVVMWLVPSAAAHRSGSDPRLATGYLRMLVGDAAGNVDAYKGAEEIPSVVAPLTGPAAVLKPVQRIWRYTVAGGNGSGGGILPWGLLVRVEQPPEHVIVAGDMALDVLVVATGIRVHTYRPPEPLCVVAACLSADSLRVYCGLAPPPPSGSPDAPGVQSLVARLVVLDSASLVPRAEVDLVAGLTEAPPEPSTQTQYGIKGLKPGTRLTRIAAHPNRTLQFSVAFSDGSVHVVELNS